MLTKDGVDEWLAGMWRWAVLSRFGSMASSLVWISGASGGIGQALATTVPWDNARVIGMALLH